MSEEHPKLSGLQAISRLLGALLYGRYPDDSKARKRAASAGVAATLISLVVWMLIRSDGRTDRIIETQQIELREAIAGVHRLAAAVEAQTIEMRESRAELLQKIPDAKPTPRAYLVKPERGSTRR